MLFTKSVIAIVSVLATASSVSAKPARLTQRDFFCDVKNVHCCEEVLSNKDAGEALGGLLNIPASIIGNVGLGCAVSRPAALKCMQAFFEIADVGSDPMSLLSYSLLVSLVSVRAARAPLFAAQRCIKKA